MVDGQAALSAQVDALRDEVAKSCGGRRWASPGRRDRGRLAQLEAALAGSTTGVRLHEMAQAICDREPLQRERLRSLRASDGYLAPFSESEPLVSVVIPTFDNHDSLRERSIPSILEQTYQHFEVVVVGEPRRRGARRG